MRSAFPMWWVCYPMSAAGVTFAAGSPISRGFRLLCSDGTLFSLFIISSFFKFLRPSFLAQLFWQFSADFICAFAGDFT